MVDVQPVFSQKQREALTDDSPTPLYFRLYSLLKNCIIDGTFTLGAQLPTEKQLSQEFAVSRITAKRSLDELAAEGLVERHPGKGTHVIYQYKPKPVHAPLVGMLQEIESMALHSTAIVLDCARLQPPQKIRDEFGMQAGETALYLARVRERNKLKFGYYTSWTVGIELPDDPNIFVKTPRLAYFREHGLEMTHVTQTLRAVGANQDAADALGVEPGSPLLHLTRRSFNTVDGKESLIDHLTVVYHPDRFQYRMDLRIN